MDNETNLRGRKQALSFLLACFLFIVVFFMIITAVDIDENEEEVVIRGYRNLYDDEEKEVLISTSCNPDVYYDSIQSLSRTSWTREILQPLLENTQIPLPYTNSDKDDVWKALQDVDRGDDAESVRLIYSQKDVPSEPKGTPSTWNREHTWPKSLGVGKSGPDFTDVHHLFPADWSVNSARSNRYFDICNDQSVCRPPSELLQGNEKNNDGDVALYGGDVFQPPMGVRGDIARAMFYMDLRYPHLELTDFPTIELKNQMAYLSTLLTWHEDDPPTNAERIRNNRVCSRWQGNRNPFVDYPDLVTSIYGSPYKTPLKEPPTMFPTKLPVPGDVMITAVHSDNPDLVALVTLVDLPSGLTFHMTDNAYNGNSFASNEGTISLTLRDTVPAGTIFGYGEELLYGSSWISEVDKGFRLSTSGDTVIIYCTKTPEDTEYTYLSALSYSGSFKVSGEVYGTSSSTLPESIVFFSVALNHKDNYVYIGPTTDIKESLQKNLVDARNWEGSNTKSLFSSAPPQIFIVNEPR
mmetsp:Transcript_50339/g.56254  ORF Transcript_50339/g.56254 Transcript_50339/m.56254 type:complete len:523 (-) Transcript_50339:522-2090(-)